MMCFKCASMDQQSTLTHALQYACPHLARGEAHDRLAIFEHSQHASLHNVESVTGFTLADNLALLGHNDLLQDVAQLPASRIAELLQQWDTTQCLKAPRMPQLPQVTKQRREGLSV